MHFSVMDLGDVIIIDRKLVEIGYFEEIAAGWVGGGEGGEAP